MDESWKRYAKKPVTKDHVLYDCIYMKCPEQANLLRQNIVERFVVAKGGVGDWDDGYGVWGFFGG